MIIAPARGADCPLEFVEADMEKMRPGGEWEVLGYVYGVLRRPQSGTQAPQSF